MSQFLKFLLFFQISLIVTTTLAQITFTREWVTGKRSSPTRVPGSRHEPCVTFLPTIELLMEIEELQRLQCPGGLKFPGLRPIHTPAGNRLAGDVLRVKGEEEGLDSIKL